MTAPPSSPPARVALLGAGGIGMVHAANLMRGFGSFSLISVADPDPVVRDRAEVTLGVPAHPDWTDSVADPTIDAVLICSASGAHCDQVVAAAEAGKHIFCEKPLALTLEDCDRAIVAADRAGVVLQVGFNRRYDPSAAALAGEVRSGRLGRVLLGRITSRDPVPPPPEHPRSLTGLFVESAIHDFDMVRFLTGEDPIRLTSYAGALVDPLALDAGDNDTAMTMLELGSGALITIDNCRLSVSGYDQRIEIHGTDGTARTENVRPVALTLDSSVGSTRSPGAWFYPERYAQSYALELAGFRRALDGAPTEVTGRDGKAALSLALSAARSVAESRTIELAGRGA